MTDTQTAKKHSLRGLRRAVGVLLVIGVAGGCGVKAPPVPPRRYLPPAVTDLSHRLTDQGISLSWSIPDAARTAGPAADGCIVYEARQPVAYSACPDCSEPFAAVADRPVPKDAAGELAAETMSYTVSRPKGFMYSFKVACYDRDGRLGADSNIVTVEY